MIGKSCKYILDPALLPRGIEILQDKIFISSQDLCILSTCRSHQIKINQTLCCKISVAVFRPCTLDYNVEPKQTSKETLQSEKRAYSFNNSFIAFQAGKGLFLVHIECLMVI